MCVFLVCSMLNIKQKQQNILKLKQKESEWNST